ncbi:MAG: sulfatase-like hydrolase/transferase [Gemmatimonadaceae bacterium]
MPSHCSLFTGLDAQRTSCRWTTPLDSRATTLAEVLKGRGYRTGGFVANHFYTTRETGLSRGFDRWMDFQRTWKEVFCSTVLVQTGIVRSALWGATPRERLSGILRFKLRGDPKPEHDREDARR